MGQITREHAVATLRRLNPKMPLDRICVYADAMLTYMEASENITRNGAITAHPRTGAPLENPYLKVRKAAGDTIAKFRMNTGDLWENHTSSEPPA